MKRWLALFSAFGLMAAAAFFYAHRQHERQRQLERFDQIQIGMTKAEVVALIGEGSDVSYTIEPRARPNLIVCRMSTPWETRPRFYVTLDEDFIVVKKYARFEP